MFGILRVVIGNVGKVGRTLIRYYKLVIIADASAVLNFSSSQKDDEIEVCSERKEVVRSVSLVRGCDDSKCSFAFFNVHQD